MNIPHQTSALCISIVCLIASGCRAAQPVELTSTPTLSFAQPPTATLVFTATPLPTDSPPPTVTPLPTTPAPTSTSTPSPTPEGRYTTEFDGTTELKQWQSFLIDPNTLRKVERSAERVTEDIQDGVFRFEIRQKFTWVYYIYGLLEAADVQVETEATNRGRNTNNVSLICRYSDAGWYEFNIGNSGLYNIFRYDPNAGNYVLLADGGTININTGQGTNRYTAICQGDQLSLYINGGTAVKTVTDRQLNKGKIGLSVSSFEVAPIIVEFDWLRVSAPSFTPAVTNTPQVTRPPPIATQGVEDVFVGTWAVRDKDGSSTTLTVVRSGAGYNLTLHDDGASVCGLDSAGNPQFQLENTLVGTVSGSVLNATTTSSTCLTDPPSPGPMPNGISVIFIYDAPTDTLVDNFGIVWRRQ